MSGICQIAGADPTATPVAPSRRSRYAPAMLAIIRTMTLAAALAASADCTRQSPLVSRPAEAPRAIVFRNVRVFDAPRAQLFDGRHDVLVHDGRVTDVGPLGLEAPGAVEVNGDGDTLLPGLVDVHTHTGSSVSRPGRFELPDVADNLATYLYAGVTTVLDLGSLSPDVFRERAKIAAGTHLGPHMYAAGPIFTAPGGHPVEMLRPSLPWFLRWYVIPHATREVATPADARAAVAGLLPERPDILKIALDAGIGDVPVLAPETLAAIVESGHAAGVRSIVHVGSSAEAAAAVQAGADALAHSPWRDELSDETVALIASHDVVVVPTLAIFDLAGADRASLDDYLPIEREVATAATLQSFLASGDDRPPDPHTTAIRAAFAAGHGARQRNVAKLRAAGVTLLAGSDSLNPAAFPGAGLHLELTKLVAAGLTPGEALRAATWSNARFLAGESADFGAIVRGKRADLVLVEGDPTAHIEDLGRIRAVVLDGTPLVRGTPR